MTRNCLAVLWIVGVVTMGVSTLRGDETAGELLVQAQAAAANHDSREAVRLATAAIAKDDKLAYAYYLRGCEHFRLSEMDKSVADFDRFVALAPDRESRLWERGISQYYAKQFQAGAKQFELYQTFYNNDVENSVWRYLCMAPTEGGDKARAALLPIENDRRVPMMQVYELFRGRAKPEDVLSACTQGNPAAEALAGRLFYAHLYLGLYYHAAGDKEQERKYIDLAADKELATNPAVSRYMWDVARVHAEWSRRQK